MTRGHYLYDVDELGLVSLDQYKGTSFVFVLAMTRTDFDIMDNPYVQVEAYKVSTGWEISRNDEIGIRKCTEEDLEFMKDYLNQYQNSVCIDDYTNF